ncbi:MAG: response regulator [Planctomycetes bacterium]|nr:response regulator [Planctomycetota bacterium]
MAHDDVRILRTDPTMLRSTLDSIDEAAAQVTVEFADASGAWIRRMIPTRNISRDGLSILTDHFVYPGTRCRVSLLSLHNHQHLVAAKVVRCRYLSGSTRLHEVGIRFDSPIDIALFHRGATYFRLLLCDDDATIHQLVPRLLNHLSCQITAFKSGDEAIAAARNGVFDLILLDLDMPEKDGIATARELREAGFIRPILALTTHADSEILKRALAAGCTAIHKKPFTRDSLTNAIRSMMSEPIISSMIHDRSMISLIDPFVAALPASLRELESAFAKSDLERLAKVCAI